MMQVGRVDREHRLRSMATATLLGYRAPSFTYRSDLLLPSGENSKLRQEILKQAFAAASGDKTREEELEDMDDLDIIRAFIHHALDAKGLRNHLYIPEVRVDMK